MAPKKNAKSTPVATEKATATGGSITFGHSTPDPAKFAQTSTSQVPTKPSATSTTTTKVSKTSSNSKQNAQEIAIGIWNNYVENTPQRMKLIDVFMVFLIVVGVVQFVYCVLAGSFPFNAFLSGFSATVGQFVLTGMCYTSPLCI